MKKSMSKRLIAIITIVSVVVNNTSLVYANEINKKESVYVTLNNNGKEIDKIVSDWIHSNNSNVTISDESRLDDIKNVKGEEKPEKNGSKLTWTIKDNDLYYQGISNEELPFGVDISYYLDGNKVSSEDIAGKSGKIKIELKFANYKYKEKKINNSNRKIYLPIAIAGSVSLPNDIFKNVKINDGKVTEEGNTSIVSFAALPGMKDSLNLKLNEDLSQVISKFSDTITIEADATDFKLGPIMMCATTSVPELDSLDKADSIDKVKDSLEKLKSSSDLLASGANQLKNGTDKASEKLFAMKKLMNDPKLLQKVNLIMNEKNVSLERRLIEDALKAESMDTDEIKELLSLLTSGNIDKANILFNDVKDLSQYKDLLNTALKTFNNLGNDKNIQKIFNDVQATENAYKNIDSSTKRKIEVFESALTKDNIKNGQEQIRNLQKQLVTANSNIESLQKKGNKLCNDVDDLKKEIISATNSNSEQEAMIKIRNQINKIKQFYSASEQAKMKIMISDISDYGKAYMILKAYIIADTQQNMSKYNNNQELAFKEAKQKAIGIINGVYKNQSSELVALINKFTLKDFTETQLKNDYIKLNQYSNEMKDIMNMINDSKPLIDLLDKAEPILLEAESILKGDEIKNIKYLSSSVKSIANDKFISSLIMAYLSLSDEDIDNIISLKEKIMILSSDIKTNQETIKNIETIISGFKCQDADIKRKIEKTTKDINEAKSMLDKVDKLSNNLDKTRLNKIINMSKELLNMQQDLKNSEDILRITQDALSKGNINQARSLINSLPSLENGVKQLSDGVNSLNSGMEKFKNEGIDKIYNKSTDVIENADELLSIKDEMVKMSKEYDNFAGKDSSMNGSVKFILKTEEIKAIDSKSKKIKVSKAKKQGFIEWLKKLFK